MGEQLIWPSVDRWASPRRLAARIVFAGLVALTLVKALAPGGGPPAGFIDKLHHGFAFYVLAIAAAASAPRSRLALPAVGLALLGALIEVLQSLPIVGRSCDFDDWIADMTGVALAYAPLLLARWRAAFQA